MVKLALALVLLSGVFWFSMLAVPFVPLPLSAWQKGALALGLFIAAEVAFWAGALLVGKQLLFRYLGKLWPKRWRLRKQQKRNCAADAASDGNCETPTAEPQPSPPRASAEDRQQTPRHR